MQQHNVGGSVTRIFITILLIAGFSHADTKVTIRDISQAYQNSQKAFSEAENTKSIERLLRSLTLADDSNKSAREMIQMYEPKNDAEQRMKNRLSQKLAEDADFLRDFKVDLGLAEVDSIESYRTLRLSFLQDPEQKNYVIKMDLQMLITMDQKSKTKSRITTR